MNPHIQDFLEVNDCSYRVHHHKEIMTAADAKSALIFPVTAMVKCLAFALPKNRFALIGLNVNDQADYKKISSVIGVRRQDLKLATEEDVHSQLHMQPGGIGPFSIFGTRVVLDTPIANLSTIFCGTGRCDSTLEITSAELIRINNAVVADVSKRT